MSFRGVFIAGLTALTVIGGLTTIGASTARAASAITLPGDLALPESLAASSDGTLFIGSAKMGGVVRVAPGSSTPTSWITPTTFGTRSISECWSAARPGSHKGHRPPPPRSGLNIALPGGSIVGCLQ